MWIVRSLKPTIVGLKWPIIQEMIFIQWAGWKPSMKLALPSWKKAGGIDSGWTSTVSWLVSQFGWNDLFIETELDAAIEVTLVRFCDGRGSRQLDSYCLSARVYGRQTQDNQGQHYRHHIAKTLSKGCRDTCKTFRTAFIEDTRGKGELQEILRFGSWWSRNYGPHEQNNIRKRPMVYHLRPSPRLKRICYSTVLDECDFLKMIKNILLRSGKG